MTTYVKISTIPRYPDLRVSPRMTEIIKCDGLIEPIILDSPTVVNDHGHNRERCEAFIREVESLTAQGIAATDSIIIVYWDDLDEDEQREYS